MGVLAAAAMLVALPLAVELWLRRMGAGTFPLYERTADGNYRMRSDQTGVFLRRHAWRYDANGMRNDRVPPGLGGTTLLVGDSVVDGGLRIGQAETLGSVAARISGESFYTVACHGWALANSLAALKAVPGWADAERLVFVINSGDLDLVTRMAGELSFPSRRPRWLTLWLARRQAFRQFGGLLHAASAQSSGPAQPAAGGAQALRAANLALFRELLGEYSGPVFVLRYPMRGEAVRAEPFFDELAALDPRVRLLDVADAPDWSDDCYIDHIHPNARGLQVLARRLCEGLN